MNKYTPAVTGLTPDALTAAGVVRPTVTLDSLRADAKRTGRAQVIAHISDPSRVVAVQPSGGVWGTSGEPMGWGTMFQMLGTWEVAYDERIGEVIA